MRILPTFFSRRWLPVTLLVSIILFVLARLGFWQLDRLQQRRDINARARAQIQSAPLELTGSGLQVDLTRMEYRTVIVTGRYDFDHQVALRNQDYHMLLGAHLLTPLIIDGGNLAVVVDRGWIPQDSFLSGDWERFNEPGNVQIRGVIRLSESEPQIGSVRDPVPAAGEPPLQGWSFANVAAIARQLPYDLLPVYVQQAPDAAWSALPHRSLPELELTEGPHMSYALQWFSFAAILAFGYPFFVYKRSRVSTSLEH